MAGQPSPPLRGKLRMAGQPSPPLRGKLRMAGQPFRSGAPAVTFLQPRFHPDAISFAARATQRYCR